MPAPTYTVPTNNTETAVAEPLITIALSDLKTLLTGGLDEDNIDATADIPLSALATGSNHQVPAVGGAGAMGYRTVGGAVTTNVTASTLDFTIATASDTQSATIATTGVLTGVSIIPGAGTYWALGTAELDAGTGAITGNLAIRVNSSAVITGPKASVDVDQANVQYGNLVVAGLISPTAGQAVDLHGTITVIGSGQTGITAGRLTLLRVS